MVKCPKLGPGPEYWACKILTRLVSGLAEWVCLGATPVVGRRRRRVNVSMEESFDLERNDYSTQLTTPLLK